MITWLSLFYQNSTDPLTKTEFKPWHRPFLGSDVCRPDQTGFLSLENHLILVAPSTHSSTLSTQSVEKPKYKCFRAYPSARFPGQAKQQQTYWSNRKCEWSKCYVQKLLCDNVPAGHGLVTGRSLSLGGADAHIYTQTCRQRGVCVCVWVLVEWG